MKSHSARGGICRNGVTEDRSFPTRYRSLYPARTFESCRRHASKLCPGHLSPQRSAQRSRIDFRMLMGTSSTFEFHLDLVRRTRWNCIRPTKHCRIFESQPQGYFKLPQCTHQHPPVLFLSTGAVSIVPKQGAQIKPTTVHGYISSLILLRYILNCRMLNPKNGQRRPTACSTNFRK